MLMKNAISNSQSCDRTLNNVKIVCEEVRMVTGQVVGSGTLLTCMNVHGNFPVIASFPDSSVTAVINPNGTVVSNLNQIQALVVSTWELRFLPTGIKKMFPSLKLLLINNSQLSSLKKENLREFGDSLEYIIFEGNQLTSLDADLLQYQTKLKIIYFSYNPFQYIDPLFFENLKKLRPTIERIHFPGSRCINVYFVVADGRDINTFLWRHSCENNVAAITSDLSTVNGRVEHSLNNEFCLDSKFELSTKQIIENDKSIATSVNSRIDSVESSNQKIIDDNKKLQGELANSTIQIVENNNENSATISSRIGLLETSNQKLVEDNINLKEIAINLQEIVLNMQDEIGKLKKKLRKTNCIADRNSAKLDQIYKLIAS